MDIATAEFFRKEREQCTTRDAKHVMPIRLIPDLEWEFIENIGVIKSDKGVTIYCIKETEDENEDTQVTEVSEPKTDVKTPENIEPVVTEAVEAPRATQTKEDSNVTEIEEPRYEHHQVPVFPINIFRTQNSTRAHVTHLRSSRSIRKTFKIVSQMCTKVI